MRLTVAEAIERLDDHERGFPEPDHEATFLTLFRHGSMEVEYYRPRGEDLQTPHTRDELYLVATGSGRFEHEGQAYPVGVGDVIFVAAGDRHRFVDFSEDFSTWVIFYGPEGGER